MEKKKKQKMIDLAEDTDEIWGICPRKETVIDYITEFEANIETRTYCISPCENEKRYRIIICKRHNAFAKKQLLLKLLSVNKTDTIEQTSKNCPI